ncbi:pyridoxal phosphate-dependent aminotransferase [Vibrio sp. 10N.261.46.E12]|uniref:pyridoxal phosphate-dependent aminotransferase n=1 Tax=unclassified Vibrio TaxID=2614977 RepID=UPI0009760849|nr:MULTISPECIES: pyridoxal phosphate-dependent aminotransferase [unclassified Vibrio]OMO36061.1 aminotransferase class I/II [Vibrio sp. 10N.261.45.E1]PMJ26887.1 aminotransferase class I/II [Vibrio sp. 10N.286.45.B6]PML94178.1 aminotransferase class I/II [Vibrio sp. 10N.261.49.E11]PMM82880.1 aminotransferase class I/II [Vibrio sp. 10N.261.46.E8]PMN46319.1 aminotransferase class I/II [Vibrio sp. 10N.261.45.E11]
MERDTFSLLETIVKGYEKDQKHSNFKKELLDLSIGNPDLTPDIKWIKRLQYFINQNDLHGYADFRPDINEHLCSRFTAYYHRRFLPNNTFELLDPKRNVVDLLGSKEGIFYSLLACLKSGESVLMPDPSYTVYQSCAQLIGAKVEHFSCDELGQPDLNTIKPEQVKNARMMVVCSPNNPTGIALSPKVLKDILDFAEIHDLWVIVDRAYAEITPENSDTLFNGAALPLPGALSRVLELHSLSKSCSLAGWRIGFAVGAEELVQKIRKIKFNTDFGTFLPIQCVAAEMLDELESISEQNSIIYSSRMNKFIEGVRSLGWSIPKSQGTFFLWASLPDTFLGGDDLAFVENLLDSTGILVAPGSGFGPNGFGKVRIALVQPDEVIDEVLDRLSKWEDLALDSECELTGR